MRLMWKLVTNIQTTHTQPHSYPYIIYIPLYTACDILWIAWESNKRLKCVSARMWVLIDVNPIRMSMDKIVVLIFCQADHTNCDLKNMASEAYISREWKKERIVCALNVFVGLRSLLICCCCWDGVLLVLCDRKYHKDGGSPQMLHIESSAELIALQRVRCQRALYANWLSLYWYTHKAALGYDLTCLSSTIYMPN